MKLYAHPISSFSQKVLTALYEKNIAFQFELVRLFDPSVKADFKKTVHALGKIPVLELDDGRRITESSIIIEYLEDNFEGSGTRLIPSDKKLALEARRHDRYFDLYFNVPMSTVFWNPRRPPELQNPKAVTDAKATLDVVYAEYDAHFSNRTWAIGDEFSIADCAAATALCYLRKIYPFEQFSNLHAYAKRLSERPSYRRVLTEAEAAFAQFPNA